MKILVKIDVAVSRDRGADYAVIELSRERADQMLTLYNEFIALTERPGIKPLWMTVLDDAGITFYNSRGTLPVFENAAAKCVGGYTVLPDALELVGEDYTNVTVPGVKPHMIVSKQGISWHGMVRGNQHHGTAVLTPDLLKHAIGIKIVPGTSL